MFSKVEIDFEKIRLWAVIILIQAASFGMGMYTARTYWIKPTETSGVLNYSTPEPKSQSPAPSTANTSTLENKAAVGTTILDPANCTAIKGNISGSSKTYHVPGGSFYERTTSPEMCFATELEAQTAGFKKSSR